MEFYRSLLTIALYIMRIGYEPGKYALDATQIILAVIAILGAVLTTLLTAIGAILLFVGKHFVDQIKALQLENKEDRAAHYVLQMGLTKPLNILVEKTEEIIQNEKEHAENTKNSLDKLETLSEKLYRKRHGET